MAQVIDFETDMLEEVDGKKFDIPTLLEMEDEGRVDVAVVMPPPISVLTGETYFHPDNAGVARVIKGSPRCIGCVSVNPTFAEEAISEMEKFVRGEGFKGVKLNSELHGYNIDDPITDPVMEKARELGLVASIHSAPGNCHPNRIGRLAARFPDVSIIMDHMGYPEATEDAIRVAEECPNVVLGTTFLRFFPDKPEEAHPEAIAEAVNRLGPERVVFGSNAPEFLHSPLWTRQAIERFKLGKEAEELIFSTNLIRLYKLT